MYLTKKGTVYNGNTYKRFTRDQALDRLEIAIHNFLDERGMRKLIHLSEIYQEMSLKDKAQYSADLRRIGRWLVAMDIEHHKVEENENAKAET